MVDSNVDDMGPILRRIVEAKIQEVATRSAQVPLREMIELAQKVPSALDFREAVARPHGPHLIAEVKKASPSKGIIREDFDPVAIAMGYRKGGASAISVLTDEPFFQGSVEIFRQVREAVELPMLRKDFMIDPYQFYEARAMGADAVLLITSILTESQLREFHELAQGLGMAVLVETHSSDDIRRAIAALRRPCLLGINNRDLHNPQFKTDLGHTARMIPLIRELCGDDEMPPVISESGIYSAEDVLNLKEMGVSGVLVGESLMRQPDPGQAAIELLRLVRA